MNIPRMSRTHLRISLVDRQLILQPRPRKPRVLLFFFVESERIRTQPAPVEIGDADAGLDWEVAGVAEMYVEFSEICHVGDVGHVRAGADDDVNQVGLVAEIGSVVDVLDGFGDEGCERRVWWGGHVEGCHRGCMLMARPAKGIVAQRKGKGYARQVLASDVAGRRVQEIAFVITTSRTCRTVKHIGICQVPMLLLSDIDTVNLVRQTRRRH